MILFYTAASGDWKYEHEHTEMKLLPIKRLVGDISTSLRSFTISRSQLQYILIKQTKYQEDFS